MANENEMVTYEFKFKINPSKYAERFGIDIPDDTPDAITTEDCAIDCVPTQDAATVSFGKQVKATLAQCKAQNPMTCRFHGTQAMAQDIEQCVISAFQAKGQQFNGTVNVNINNVTGGILNCTATITGGKQDAKTIQDAMGAFFQLPGVDGDVTDIERDRKNYASVFEMDTLDPQAKARWGFGSEPQTGSQSVQAPAATPVATPATATASAPAPKRTRQRKMVTPAPVPAPAPEPQPEVAEQPVTTEPEPAPVSVPEVDDSGFELPASDDPVLLPGVPPKEPPPYNPPYTAAEIDSINKMALRLVKTARQINKHIDENKTDSWLQGAAPNQPKSIVNFKKEVDGTALHALAAKDTDGQVKALQDLMDEILTSEANGWKTKVAEPKWDLNSKAYWDATKKGNVDIHFDGHKYDDPYAKEREAFKNYKPSGDSRKDALASLKQVEDSKSKDAPKDAAKEAKEVSKELDALEKDYESAKNGGVSDDILKVFGQFYHKATKKFDEAVKKCKDWIGKLFVIGSSVEDTIEKCKDRGLSTNYLNRHRNQLKKHEPLARKLLKGVCQAYAADPENAEKLWKKNIALLPEGASFRIDMPFQSFCQFIAEPKSGTRSGRYEASYAASDYVGLAKQSFDYVPTDAKTVHKYAAMVEKTGKYNGFLGRDVEVELDARKMLFFLGGKISHTRPLYSQYGRGCKEFNASLLSDCSIATATQFQGPGLEELMSTDFTKVKNGAYHVLQCLKKTRCSYGSGYGDGAEVWIAMEDLTRDLMTNAFFNPSQEHYFKSRLNETQKKFLTKQGISI